MTTINGTAKADQLTDKTSDGRSYLYGLGGDDTIHGGINQDYLHGGDGNDSLFGDGGNDWLWGDNGADRLNGGAGFDGATYISTTGVTVSLDGSLKATAEAVGDTFISIENLEGSDGGKDILAGNGMSNDIWAYAGNDIVYGRGGDDYIDGGSGDDKMYGGGGDDGLVAGGGRDYLNGGVGFDYAEYHDSSAITASLDGSLAAKGDAAGDTYFSIENLEGSDGGNDVLAGNGGKNELWGALGNDRLYGRAGDDRLYGNGGTDTLYGEAGHDTFAFKYAEDAGDRIMDFAAGDKIGFRSLNFGKLAAGTLAASRFHSGFDHTAASSAVRFLFDQTDHSLWYDRDGTGVAAAVKIATLVNGYALSFADIVVMPEP